jgi:two-component system NtrC family response regulator
MKRGKMRLTDEAVQKLLQYSWPGNIRELQNCIERAVILSDGQTIDEKDVLTSSPASTGSIADYLNLEVPLPEIRRAAADEAERCAVLKAWKDSDHNAEKAAQILGITVKTLSAKLKDLKLL